MAEDDIYGSKAKYERFSLGVGTHALTLRGVGHFNERQKLSLKLANIGKEVHGAGKPNE